MLTHRDLHVQIPRRATINPHLALSGQADTVAGIHPGRHFDRQCFLLPYAPLAMTGFTGILDHLAGATAGRARLLHSKEALLHPHLAHTLTGTTGFRPRSEEHTSELQSRPHLVCRLLLEKKKKNTYT